MVVNVETRPESAKRVLSVPPAGHAHYARNFIRLAVCELRFPTMLEYEERPPTAFAKAVRREYPTYERLTNLQIESGNVAQSVGHAFKSKNGRWTATVRTAALSLETARYDSYEEFRARLAALVKAAGETIQSEFFTRVGLRYINAIPCALREVGDWVNPDLVHPLAAGTYGDAEEHWQRVRGPTQNGGYNFMHGLAKQAKSDDHPEYVLDFDFFREDVDVSSTLQVVEVLHSEVFSMFRWALGERSKAHLGESLLPR